jgi:hypothetical protein
MEFGRSGVAYAYCCFSSFIFTLREMYVHIGLFQGAETRSLLVGISFHLNMDAKKDVYSSARTARSAAGVWGLVLSIVL